MKWTLERRKITAIFANPQNPRRMTTEQAAHLQESISKFGVCEPIVINVDGSIIGGHQRFKTLKKMGYKEVDVYVPDHPLDFKEAGELNIRLNKNTGEWDFDSLANHWEAADLVEYGFTPEELHLESVPGIEGEENEKQNSPAKMIITFSNAEQLQEAENKISTIVDGFEGASYKVKI